jgi:hypothetical protein
MGKNVHVVTNEIFILEGIITVVIAAIAAFFLVDFPDKAKFLKPDEKQHVLNRLNIERGDGETHNLTWKTFRLHMSDWNIWFIALIYLCNVGPIYSLAYFIPSILGVRSLKYRLTLGTWVQLVAIHYSGCSSVHCGAGITFRRSLSSR